MLNNFVPKSYFFMLFFAFEFIQVNAENIKSIKSMHQIFDGIGHLNSDIFAFAKSTMEEDFLYNQNNSEPQKCAQLLFDLKSTYENSKNDDDNIGIYLNSTTDEELRERIAKDHATEGKKLLNDCFNTVMYTALQKELKFFISTMSSCSLLSREESNKLTKLKIFYPNNYNSSLYKWEPIFKDNKLCTLEGRLHQVIGLKGNKNNTDESCFLMAIDTTYVCYLGKTEERTLNLKAPSFDLTKNNAANPKLKVWIDPQHFMNITITFLRQKNLNEFCTVSFSCYAFGNERLSIDLLIENDNYGVEKRKCDFEESHISPAPGESYIFPGCVETDEVEEETQIIYESCMINTGVNFEFYHELVSQCSDFIIETPKISIASLLK